MATTILSPDGAPDWVRDAGSLWNRVEAAENRVDAQLAREFILAVPVELSLQEQFQLAVDWSRQELVSAGMVAQVCLHHAKDGANPHAHVLCTMRRLSGDKFSAKKATEWNDVTLLLEQRKSWAHAVNDALEKAGNAARVDHRSLKDQHIDRMPEPKIGVAATAMKKRGVVADPRRFQEVRFVKAINAAMPQMRAMWKNEAAAYAAAVPTLWKKSISALAQAKHAARETVLDVWHKMRGRKMPDAWWQTSQDATPPRDRTPDVSR